MHVPETDFTPLIAEPTEQRILPANTRLDGSVVAPLMALLSPGPGSASAASLGLVVDADEDSYILASERRAADKRRVDLDSVRGLAPPTSSAGVAEGFEFVMEPSVTPFRAPIVTWGVLEATPRRVEPSTEFAILRTPVRETIAHGLVDQAAARLKSKSKTVGIPAPGTSTLAERLSRRGSGVDAALRASYTPARLSTTGDTPRGLTTPQFPARTPAPTATPQGPAATPKF